MGAAAKKHTAARQPPTATLACFASPVDRFITLLHIDSCLHVEVFGKPPRRQYLSARIVAAELRKVPEPEKFLCGHCANAVLPGRIRRRPTNRHRHMPAAEPAVPSRVLPWPPMLLPV